MDTALHRGGKVTQHFVALYFRLVPPSGRESRLWVVASEETNALDYTITTMWLHHT